MSTLQNQFYQDETGKWHNNLNATYKDKNGKAVSGKEYWAQ